MASRAPRDKPEGPSTAGTTIELTADAGQAFFDEMVELFVLPEVKRRRSAGTLDAGEAIFRFQVLFPEGKETVIRLNQQVGGLTVSPF